MAASCRTSRKGRMQSDDPTFSRGSIAETSATRWSLKKNRANSAD